MATEKAPSAKRNPRGTMEPSNPGNTHTPTAYPQGPEQPKKRWPLSRKMTIIIGAALAVIAVVFLVIQFNSEKKSGGNNTDRASFYIQRPGFENIGDGVGDAMALISKPTNKVVQYGGANVVQACTILTIKDVRDAGLKIEANLTFGSIQRTFMDGEGPGVLPKSSDNFLPSNDETNHCQYNLEDSGMVELTVYQPAYTNQKAIDNELKGAYTPGANIEGFQTYSATDVDKSEPNDTTVFLRSVDVSAALRINVSDQAIREKLVKLTAQRLRQALTTPTPIEEFVYDSPIFTEKAVNGCTLVSNTEFKAILGVDSGPYVDEMMSTAVGVDENSATKELYNYVTHHCKRRSPEGSTKDRTLTIRVDTYETAEGAKANTQNSTKKDIQPITPTIGDESFYAEDAGLDKAIIMRKGRIIVRVNYYLPRGNDDVTAAQRIQALTPLVTTIANQKLAGY